MPIYDRALLWLQGNIYVVPPKCGSTSMKNAKGVQRPFSLEDATERGLLWDEIILVVRHPEDRLQSCWRNLYSHMTWEEFVDSVLGTPVETADVHIRPQSWFMGDVTPDATMTVGDVASDLPKARIGCLNKSDRETFVFPAYRRAELLQYYSEDVALFNSRRG